MYSPLSNPAIADSTLPSASPQYLRCAGCLLIHIQTLSEHPNYTCQAYASCAKERAISSPRKRTCQGDPCPHREIDSDPEPGLFPLPTTAFRVTVNAQLVEAYKLRYRAVGVD
jgi:hypothetical protein